MPLSPASRIAQFESAWEAASQQIEAYLREVDQLPVTPDRSSSEIEQELAESFDFQLPIDPQTAVAKVAELLRSGQTHTPHRHYYGLFNPDVLPVTIAADAIAAAFNPQLATVHHSPAAIAMESHVLAFFQKRLGHRPSASSACFTNAGSEANHSGVLCALTAAFPEFGEQGASGRPVLYVSAEAHHSFVKIAHAAGIGRSAVCEVPTTAKLALDVAALRILVARHREEGRSPFLVVGTGGTTAAGVIDPLPEIAALCREEQLWFHADAAWGGGALISPRLAPALAGIEQADSVTIDAHKWLSVPMAAGMFFCRRRDVVLQTFGAQTSYMPIDSDRPDPFVGGMQWSRRFIGLKLFLAMAVMGIDAYAEVVEGQADVGEYLKEALTLAGWLVANETPFPLANFTHPRIELGEATIEDVLAQLNRRRLVWVSDVRLSNGRRVLRACITNYRTDRSDIDHLVSELNLALEAAANRPAR